MPHFLCTQERATVSSHDTTPSFLTWKEQPNGNHLPRSCKRKPLHAGHTKIASTSAHSSKYQNSTHCLPNHSSPTPTLQVLGPTKAVDPAPSSRNTPHPLHLPPYHTYGTF